MVKISPQAIRGKFMTQANDRGKGEKNACAEKNANGVSLERSRQGRHNKISLQEGE